MRFLQNKGARAVALLAPLGALFATSAHAALDVSASVTEIGEAKTAALAIGAAVMAVAIGVMLYKWARKAL